MGETRPERWVNRPESQLLEHGFQFRVVSTCLFFDQQADGFVFIPCGRGLVGATQVRMDLAYGATILHAACHQALLGVVCHVCCEDGPYPTNLAIGTGDIDSRLADFGDRSQNEFHAVVEELISRELASFLAEAVEFANGNISDENSSMRGCLASNVFCDVADSEVNGPRALVSTKLG